MASNVRSPFKVKIADNRTLLILDIKTFSNALILLREKQSSQPGYVNIGQWIYVYKRI